MKLYCQITALAVVLGCLPVAAQTVFDENFDGGYTGGFGTGHYTGGSPTGTSVTVLSSGGNPNGCVQIQMTSATSGDSLTAQIEMDTVTPYSDPNPADYTIAFDAYGSQAANVQLILQTWAGDYYSGGQIIQATANDQLTAANTWQTFTVNLGTLTVASPVDATWQVEFQINASQWGGAGKTDTLKIDNIILTHIPSDLEISSSANPSTSSGGVIFTGAIVNNGSPVTSATGQVVFSDANGPFSTNTMTAGIATTVSITTLPVGADTIGASYTGNFPATSNSFTQIVNTPSGGGSTATNLAIYTDNLVNGFQNYSWATVNVQNTSPVHSGAYSISVTDGGYQALSCQGEDINSTPYTSLTFWINGGSSGGQRVQVFGLLDGNNQGGYPIAALPTNSWTQITIPLASLKVAGKPNFDGIWIQGSTGSSQPTFYVDDISLVPAPLPSAVHLGVDAGEILQTVDARQFGLNTATWDNELGASETLPLLKEIGCSALRWPGGSTADANYNWYDDLNNNAIFQYTATNLGAQVFTTVNYGTGTAGEAAAWVLYANKTNQCNFKYWEVGNECYGSWETDNHTIEHDPYTYATNAVAYIQQMKAAFPNFPIKVGVVVVPGEGSYSNNADHYAVNPITHTTNYGWTPVVLSTMASLGVLPDFLIYHFYAQYTEAGWVQYDESPDADQPLLQVAGNPNPSDWSDWNSAAASLRSQITDYIGTTAGSNIELCVTENNSDAGEMGRQSTSLVNALYLADSTSELMKTEFRSYIWWDLHNGADTDGDFDPTIYGWRANGDYGITDSSDNPYPTFYAEKMLSLFARAGDSVLLGTSDNLNLAAYAVHRTDGALTVLVINKNLASSLTGDIVLTNFAPGGTATVFSYGVPQDEAAELGETGAALDISTNTVSIASTNFSYVFPPLSMTVFAFDPGPPTLKAVGVSGGQVQLRLQADLDTPYVIEASSDLKHWTPISTNTLSSGSGTINVSATNATQEFYQAVWKP